MWESGSMERNLKQHHFSCDLRITMSCITVYSITDSQRTSIKSIFFSCPWEPSAASNHTGTELKDFSPSTGKYPFFSCLCIFPSFSQTAAEPYFHFSSPGQTPQSFHNGFTRKAPKAAAPVAGCRAQFTPAATSAKATAACSKAKTFWCEQS